MRKITEQAVRAFKARQNFKLGNTEIKNINENITGFYLHGNMIAGLHLNEGVRNETQLYITHCGYKTNTTKERLNGIIKAFFPNDGIYQKEGVWYIEASGIKNEFANHLFRF